MDTAKYTVTVIIQIKYILLTKIKKVFWKIVKIY